MFPPHVLVVPSWQIGEEFNCVSVLGSIQTQSRPLSNELAEPRGVQVYYSMLPVAS